MQTTIHCPAITESAKLAALDDTVKSGSAAACLNKDSETPFNRKSLNPLNSGLVFT
jgi:hypothetical protein